MRGNDERAAVVPVIEVVLKCRFYIRIRYIERFFSRNAVLFSKKNMQMCLPVARGKYTARAIKNGGLKKNGTLIGFLVGLGSPYIGIPGIFITFAAGVGSRMQEKNIYPGTILQIGQSGGCSVGRVFFIGVGCPVVEAGVVGRRRHIQGSESLFGVYGATVEHEPASAKEKKDFIHNR